MLACQFGVLAGSSCVGVFEIEALFEDPWYAVKAGLQLFMLCRQRGSASSGRRKAAPLTDASWRRLRHPRASLDALLFHCKYETLCVADGIVC